MATPRHRSLPLPGRASFRVAVVVVAVAATVGWGQAPPVQARPADAVRSVIPAPGSATSSPDTAVTIVTDPGVSIDTVSVSGSRSGDHTGELTYAREGTVSTFDPDEAFAAGETVTVSTTTTDRAHAPMSWDFVVGTPAPHPGPMLDDDQMTGPDAGRPPAAALAVDEFTTRPDLRPTRIRVDLDAGATAPGYLFATPTGSAVTDAGVQVYDDDGELVWFHPQDDVDLAANAVVEQFQGEPVLVWYRGSAPFGAGNYRGEFVVVDTSYRQVATVRMGNGYQADVHDIFFTDDGTAYLMAYNPLTCTGLAPLDDCVPGATVLEGVLQQVDVSTGTVLWEWHSLDHVPLRDTYQGLDRDFLDYFHVNSVALDRDGGVLVSARQTSALYKVDRDTGELVWTFGGRSTSFPNVVGAPDGVDGPDYPHHLRVDGDGYGWFDNGFLRNGPSLGAVADLDLDTGTATYTTTLRRDPDLYGPTQGSMQQLPDGGHLVAWGGLGTITEYDGDDQPVFDASLQNGETYRQFRFEWTGTPVERPALAVLDGAPRVAMSWNGDTRTRSWRILAGPTADDLAAVDTVARDGFETVADVAPAGWFAVQALDEGGGVLATSEAVESDLAPSPWFDESTWRAVSGTYTPIVGDFGSTRNDDVLWYAPGSTPDHLHLSDGAGGSTTLRTPDVNGRWEPVVADLVGDDRDEVLWTRPSGTTAFLWRFDGAARDQDPVIDSERVETPASVTAVVVLDHRANHGGSVHDEVLWYGAGSARDRVDRFRWWRGDDLRVTSRAVRVNGTYEPVSGDFDGNGLGDVLWHAPGSTADHVWFSTGGEAGTAGRVSVRVNAPDGGDVIAGNFVGDEQRDEVVFRNAGPAGDRLWQFPDRRRPQSTTVTESSDGPAQLLEGGNDRLVTWVPGQAPRIVDYTDRTGVVVDSGNTALGSSYELLVGDVGDPRGTSSLLWYAPGPTPELLWRG